MRCFRTKILINCLADWKELPESCVHEPINPNFPDQGLMLLRAYTISENRGRPIPCVAAVGWAPEDIINRRSQSSSRCGARFAHDLYDLTYTVPLRNSPCCTSDIFPSTHCHVRARFACRVGGELVIKRQDLKTLS